MDLTELLALPADALEGAAGWMDGWTCEIHGDKIHEFFNRDVMFAQQDMIWVSEDEVLYEV